VTSVDTKGFFASLFDMSFSSLITTKVIKALYVISLIVIGVFALFFIIGAFASSVALGVVTLVILAPLGALFYVIYTRVVLEFIIVVFRIAEYTHELVELTRAQVSPATVAAAAPTAPIPAVEPPPAAEPPPPATEPPPSPPEPPPADPAP
jgi:Domain of unknown function (DUF4282)